MENIFNQKVLVIIYYRGEQNMIGHSMKYCNIWFWTNKSKWLANHIAVEIHRLTSEDKICITNIQVF